MSTQASIMSAISGAIAEWESSPRLRYATYALICLAWVHGILLLRDAAIAEGARIAEAQDKIVRIQQAATTGDWPARSAAASKSAREYEALLWKEGGVGLSDAAFQEHISKTLATSGVAVRSLRSTSVSITDATKANESGVYKLGARLQADFRPADFYTWLNTLSAAREQRAPAVVVESMVIRAGIGQPAIAEVELAGYAVRRETPRAGNRPEIGE
jgi:hypothetical protein